MRGISVTLVLVDCLVMLSYLTFVKNTTIITRTSFRKSLGKGKSILTDAAELPVESNTGVISQPPGGKHLRKKRRLSPTLLHRRKGEKRALRKRFKKQSDDAFGQNKVGLSKRDFFFAPASPYQQIASPVDRRFFLVHRGERGNLCCELALQLFN